jgi:hypothetical protein
LKERDILKDVISKIDSTIFLDFEKFFEMQFQIFNKFDKYKDYCLLNEEINARIFISRLDKYLIHTIEEIAEAKIEININDNKNLITELCDVLLYTGTAGSILFENYKDLEDSDYIKNKLNPTLLNYNFEIPKKEKDLNKIDNYLLEILLDICFVRRIFPERKWHKKHEKSDLYELGDRCRNSIILIKKASINALEAALMVSGNLETIIEIIEEKHERLMNAKIFINE